MNTPTDKPPTRESVDAAKRFAASLPALPKPQVDPLQAFCPEPVNPSDYGRGLEDGRRIEHERVKTWMQEQADGILDKATTLILEGKHDEYADLRQCEWAFRYVLESYNVRNQAGLRKAAEAL